MRDDFPSKVKDVLAKRVGMRCSNPNCRQVTSGPQQDPAKAVNVGVAGHITAASRGGPRFDPDLSRDERRCPDNGIWLCQNCAKLVDNDDTRYTADLLRRWKELSEEAARLHIDSPAGAEPAGKYTDESLVRFYAQCFDRPAFQDPFRIEGSMEAFDKAIEDTITALNTGYLRSRDGAVLSQAKGKSFLNHAEWRRKLDVVVDLLRAIRSRYADAVKTGAIHVSDRGGGDAFYVIHDDRVAEWMDVTRAEALAVFGDVCRETGVPAPVFPRQPRRRR